MKICQKAYKICLIGFKLLPNTKLSMENFQKTLRTQPKWRNFAKSGHTICCTLRTPVIKKFWNRDETLLWNKALKLVKTNHVNVSVPPATEPQSITFSFYSLPV